MDCLRGDLERILVRKGVRGAGELLFETWAAEFARSPPVPRPWGGGRTPRGGIAPSAVPSDLGRAPPWMMWPAADVAIVQHNTASVGSPARALALSAVVALLLQIVPAGLLPVRVPHGPLTCGQKGIDFRLGGRRVGVGRPGRVLAPWPLLFFGPCPLEPLIFA